VYKSTSACRTSISAATPPSYRRCTSRSEPCRETSVRLEISSSRSSSRSWKYAVATSLISVDITNRRASGQLYIGITVARLVALSLAERSGSGDRSKSDV
jgi:hypothetical protein